MKTLYLGEMHRDVNGDFWIDDKKIDWKKMSEVQMSIYLGSLFGSLVEHMRLLEMTGSVFIEVKADDEIRKEVHNG